MLVLFFFLLLAISLRFSNHRSGVHLHLQINIKKKKSLLLTEGCKT